MEFLNSIKEQIPDYAKDIRLNLDSVVARSSLDPADALGAMLAAAVSAKSKVLVDAVRNSGQLNDTDIHAALTAAALMGMNNVWYPYVEMAEDNDLKTQRPELRMNAYATHGGVERRRFELFALASSIIGKCHFCIQSHYKLLKETGMTATQLRDVGRIAAVVSAAAHVLAAEGK
ncbi:carboxymuconolactone decarboxylase family protein [Noviherbaspirillum massiliense]|uniref:carboxymuconolactone decarboxylase family protein n=1 Tax=Noviherbaspirillum massiliense TaxID=1465823 RepID=UPI0002F7B041|nr:carboxymuconolactone decarboxylase family protein [Noviherbaspirillum massiliense]